MGNCVRWCFLWRWCQRFLSHPWIQVRTSPAPTINQLRTVVFFIVARPESPMDMDLVRFGLTMSAALRQQLMCPSAVITAGECTTAAIMKTWLWHVTPTLVKDHRLWLQHMGYNSPIPMQCVTRSSIAVEMGPASVLTESATQLQTAKMDQTKWIVVGTRCNVLRGYNKSCFLSLQKRLSACQTAIMVCWKFATGEHGERCATIFSEPLMLMWPANLLVSSQLTQFCIVYFFK